MAATEITVVNATPFTGFCASGRHGWHTGGEVDCDDVDSLHHALGIIMVADPVTASRSNTTPR